MSTCMMCNCAKHTSQYTIYKAMGKDVINLCKVCIKKPTRFIYGSYYGKTDPKSMRHPTNMLIELSDSE